MDQRHDLRGPVRRGGSGRCVPEVSVEVTGAYDAIGNLQTPGHVTQRVSGIDTQPAAGRQRNAGRAMPGAVTVYDGFVGGAGFYVRITYNEAMNTNTSPVVSFTPDVSSTLTGFNSGQSWWVSDTTYKAVFDVADANVVVPSVGITVTSARNAMGNLQAAGNVPNAFSIDTQNPAVVSLSPANGATNVDRTASLANDLRQAHPEGVGEHRRQEVERQLGGGEHRGRQPLW